MDAKTAARIEALKESMGWDDLKGVLAAQEDKFWKRHIATMKRGEPFDQRAMDFALGKLEGIRVLLDTPEKAARILAVNNSEEESA